MSARGEALSLRGVRKHYGDAEVLRDFSLEIPAGCFCTLLGASGSGKSTLLKLVAGFEAPDGGEISLGGRDLTSVPVARRNIGMVFQHYALFPHMSVSQNVAFGLQMRKLPRAEIRSRTADALEMVGLGAMGKKHPRELSGGQQQRVALARALVIEPGLLLMDEPLGALDKALRQGLQQELRGLHARLGVTIIFVTHDQEEALNLSDLLVVLDKGRIAQAGTPRDLYLNPNSRFVATFLGECNFIPLGGAIHAVRPERLRIGGGTTHAFEAVVRDIVFLGPLLRVTLVHRDDDIVALTPLNAEVKDLSAGQVVKIGFDASDAMPLGGEKNAA
jgi:ABC-type Fe3+/spermidine/putrescine transport system ATPase subunit